MTDETEEWPDDVPARELTPKQQRFVEEYLVDINATQAAIRAGYSVDTSAEQGWRLLRNAKVQEAVTEGRKRLSERTEITQDRIMRELEKIGFSSLADVTNWGIKEIAFGFTEDGKRLPAEEIGDAAMVKYVDAPFVEPLNRDDLPEHIRAAVSEVSLGKEGFKIKMHDKVGALEKMGRHLGMFKDKMEVTGKDGTPLYAPMIFKPRAPKQDDAGEAETEADNG